MSPQRLAVTMLEHQRLQLRDDLAVVAERKLDDDQVLLHGETKLVQPRNRPLAGEMERQLGEARSAPERQSLAKLPPRQLQLVGEDRLSPFNQERFETVQIELRVFNDGRVSAGDRLEDALLAANVGLDDLAQLRDV